MPFNEDIVALAKKNTLFREVLSTGPHSQVVVMSIPPSGAIGGEVSWEVEQVVVLVMSIPPGGYIGDEVHPDVDQVLVFVAGEGAAILDGERSIVGPGRLVHVPAGTRHNFVNTGPTDMRLYTVYAPPEHAPGTIHRTKADAASEPEHVPQTTSG